MDVTPVFETSADDQFQRARSRCSTSIPQIRRCCQRTGPTHRRSPSCRSRPGAARTHDLPDCVGCVSRLPFRALRRPLSPAHRRAGSSRPRRRHVTVRWRVLEASQTTVIEPQCCGGTDSPWRRRIACAGRRWPCAGVTGRLRPGFAVLKSCLHALLRPFSVTPSRVPAPCA